MPATPKPKTPDRRYLKPFNVLAALVNQLNRTLILPMMACPAYVKRTHCNICAVDDTCFYAFQNMIRFRFKARVAFCWCGES